MNLQCRYGTMFDLVKIKYKNEVINYLQLYFGIYDKPMDFHQQQLKTM